MLTRHARALTLETMLIAGTAMILVSLIGLLGIGTYWHSSGFAALPNTLPLVLAALIGAVGAQNVLGGFLLAIIAGHEAKFMRAEQIGLLPFVWWAKHARGTLKS
ncbi:hypothetical protein [Sphingomonas glacialis]|uniref:Low-salt glycan biosynthesis hexosyltransferase Agl6 C-terminal transmembrane region domain-containing protein n=1 Tax=Sphingomonas glacialis TaxID=658225 RepID=A0A502G0Y5_9SPHN|nr:hypothetical protein [Sphingomonas glacialis]TPG54763.1 hypothetical protein EAH76_09055 [Sphingomonas glacialis]